MRRTIVVLGGYGNTGRRIAELLLRETAVDILIAGRSGAKAKLLADRLNRGVDGRRARGALVDASDPTTLREALVDAALVVVASSTAAHVSTVARAALETETDYFDLQYSSRKLSHLRSLEGAIGKAGRCFITDGGFHPGIPAVMVRHVADSLDRIQRANVGSVVRADWGTLSLSDATGPEFVGELWDWRPTVFRRGEWADVSWRERKRFDFGPPFGVQPTTPMMLEEMRGLPERYPSLIETGFFMGGFNWFVDTVGMGLAWVGLRLLGNAAVKPAAALTSWGLRTFARPPFGAVVVAEASGWKGGRQVTVRQRVAHTDSYMLTAIPVAACVLQYLDGTLSRPGLWLQALVAQPRRLLDDMARLGATVEQAVQVQT